jgi:hypothetical protein
VHAPTDVQQDVERRCTKAAVEPPRAAELVRLFAQEGADRDARPARVARDRLQHVMAPRPRDRPGRAEAERAVARVHDFLGRALLRLEPRLVREGRGVVPIEPHDALGCEHLPVVVARHVAERGPSAATPRRAYRERSRSRAARTTAYPRHRTQRVRAAGCRCPCGTRRRRGRRGRNTAGRSSGSAPSRAATSSARSARRNGCATSATFGRAPCCREAPSDRSGGSAHGYWPYRPAGGGNARPSPRRSVSARRRSKRQSRP